MAIMYVIYIALTEIIKSVTSTHCKNNRNNKK